MNLLTAAHALGLCRGLGHRLARLFAERSSSAFCAPGERIAGFIFIGRPERELEERARAPLLDGVEIVGNRPRNQRIILNFSPQRCIITA